MLAMLPSDYTVPLAAVIISMASLIASVISARRTDSRTSESRYLDSLERRLQDCAEDRRRLERDNTRLMREIVGLRNGEGDS